MNLLRRSLKYFLKKNSDDLIPTPLEFKLTDILNSKNTATILSEKAM